MAEKKKREIAVSDRGVFLVESRRLTSSQIKRLRSRVRSDISSLKAKMRHLYYELRRVEYEVEEKEKLLKQLESPIIKQYIEGEKDRREKAEELLKEYLGESKFKQWREKGGLWFQTPDGAYYHLNREGVLEIHADGKWRRVCVVRPRGLPLEDYVVAVLESLKQDPKEFKRLVRRR